MINLLIKIIIIITSISVTNGQCGTHWTETECLNDPSECEWIIREGAEGPECLDIQECWCDGMNGIPPGPSGHYGDCDCDKSYGLIEMRLRYTNPIGASHIDFYYDGIGSDIICQFDNVAFNEEIECNILDYINTATNQPYYPKFKTNTAFLITHDDPSSTTCEGEYHTSCSSDIVGGKPTAGCDTDFICTGWMDGGPTNDCTNGEVPCECPPEPTLPDITECYCQNPSATGINPNSGGAGWGSCDCSGGMIELRWKYLGNDIVNIRVYNDADNTGPLVCEFLNVVPQAEITCNIWDFKDPSGNIVYDKFVKNTRFEVDHVYSSGIICSGEYHTSCSRDIVGYYATNDECTELICTGWKDADTPDDDCDDGWVPCNCPTTTSIPTTTNPITTTQCNIDDPESCHLTVGCDWNNDLGKCQVDNGAITTSDNGNKITTTSDNGNQMATTSNNGYQSTNIVSTVSQSQQQITSISNSNAVTDIVSTVECDNAQYLKGVKFELKKKTGLAAKNEDKYCDVCFCNDENEEICKDEVNQLSEKEQNKFMEVCEFKGECEFNFVGLVDGFANEIQNGVCDCKLFECKDTVQHGIISKGYKNRVFTAILSVVIIFLWC
eukprot:186094_1